MNSVFVLDTNKQPLMPCRPARARQLLKNGRAAVFRRRPFTIILKDRAGGDTQPVELRIDPGSKTTGIAIVSEDTCLWAANLEHRGQAIKASLDKRRACRRSRRNRKTRYRKPRFDNRAKPKGWLPPSLMSRVHNIETWAKRLCRFAPITSIAVETVRFDTQKLTNPEITGVEYQQGELCGYEVREYLLEKWGRKCAYCGVKNVPLEVEHIVPKARGGSNRVSNLAIACHECNQAKNTQTATEFGHPEVQAQAQQPLRDAAAVNTTRYKIGEVLKQLGLPVTFWTGGRTKHNRASCGYPKDHWIDAACVGERGGDVEIPASLKPLSIKAYGWQSRQMCRVDKYGFPHTKAKGKRLVHGFQTGDLVRLVQSRGKYQGTWVGRLAGVRTTGVLDITASVGKIGATWKNYTILQKNDGYAYA